MAAALAFAAAATFWLERGLTFIWDEFPWMYNVTVRDVGFYFHPYGGHLIAFPYFVYKAVLELFGTSYHAFAVIQVAGLLGTAAMVYVYGKRRLGPLLALAPPLALLALGSSWQVLLQPMVGIQFLCAVVPGLGAILCLELDSRRGDIAACALLVLSCAGFDQALAFLAGAIVIVALSPDWKRRAWVVAVPLIAYGGWHVWATTVEPTGVKLSNIPLLPVYFVDAVAALSSALFGLTPLIAPGPWTLLRLERSDIGVISEGGVFLILEVLVICGAIWLLRRRGPIPKTFWPAAAMLAALIAEMGIIFSPGRTAFENRYLYTGCLVLLLFVIELFRGVKTTRVTVAVAFALAFAAVFGNLARFHEGRQSLAQYSRETGAILTIEQLSGVHGNQYFSPNADAREFTPAGLWAITGNWRTVVDRYGSVADTIPQLLDQSEEVRARADRVAAIALELGVETGREVSGRDCRLYRVPGGGAMQVQLPPGGAVIAPRRPTELSLRRWGEKFGAPVGSLRAGQTGVLRIPRDPASGVPWYLGFDQGPAEVCAIGRAEARPPR